MRKKQATDLIPVSGPAMHEQHNAIADPVPQDKPPSCVPGHDGRLYPTTGQSLITCPTNIPIDTPKGKAMLMAVGNPSDIEFSNDIRDEKGQRFIVVEATHFIIFPDEGVDPETGEIKTYARSVFVKRDGRFFRTTSAHAPHRIAAALDLYTAEEWAHGIPFRITERPSARHKGGVYHDIRVEV